MPIKECKIFTYNNYPGEEVDAIIKLTIDIEEIVWDRFVYEISWMKDQDFILGTLWLRDVDVWIKPKSPILIFPELNI